MIILSDAKRIKQLDERTIGFIAAGEVVERPAQVVKELLENSLDAESKSIKIEIENGGFETIRITDDGDGIHPDDMPLALDRHATSKLRQENDLHEITTLGFRGEALASIGMVSKLRISSKTSSDSGYTVRMNFGEKENIEPEGMGTGTVVEVSDLFQNQPARLSFQRRPVTEMAKIVDIVMQHALSHPDVAFSLTNSGRIVFDVPSVAEYDDRLFDVLGTQASGLIPLMIPVEDEHAPGDERWTGWISSPDITRGKGDEVHVFINQRPIASQPFQGAIRRGYKTRLMQGRHPIAILSLDIPPSEVDVNVHPTKRDVRLKHSWRVLERLERAIAHTLHSVATAPDSSASSLGIESIKETKTEPETENYKKPSWAISATQQLTLSGDSAKSVEPEKKRPISSSPAIQKTIFGEKTIAPALSSDERDIHRYSGMESERPDSEKPLSEIINELPEMEPLAQLADSYILVQSGEELLIVDQHALHERIRYERLKEDQDQWKPQSRITPISIELNPKEMSQLQAVSSTIKSFGFEFEIDAQSMIIQSAPAVLTSSSIEDFLRDLLQDLSEDNERALSMEKIKDEMAFMRACRGAVKANEKLSIAEMRRLLEDMRCIPNPWACVHGRPTAMRLTIHSLDHHFGRHG